MATYTELQFIRGHSANPVTTYLDFGLGVRSSLGIAVDWSNHRPHGVCPVYACSE